MLLDRIQRLEDRLFSTPLLQNGASLAKTPTIADNRQHVPRSTEFFSTSLAAGSPSRAARAHSDLDESLLTLPVTHDANGNHVYRWSIIQDILEQDRSWEEAEGSSPNHFPRLRDATDIFILQQSSQPTPLRIASWRLVNLVAPQDMAEVDFQRRQIEDLMELYETCIEEFFIQVHAFYPILRQSDLYHTLHTVLDCEIDQRKFEDVISTAQYSKLLLVLCLGALAQSGDLFLPAPDFQNQGRDESPLENNKISSAASRDMEEDLWQKVQLLLGSLSSEDTIDSAQCFFLTRYAFLFQATQSSVHG
jgi:hypothetical protein